MKLITKVSARNRKTPLIIGCAFLGLSLIFLIILGPTLSSNDAYAKATRAQEQPKITGKSFRILQNGTPVNPILGVAVNNDIFFDVQVRTGIDLKKVKSKPLAVEVAIIRGDQKVSSVRFDDILELKKRNLHDWITSNYHPQDKISIELQNTILDDGEDAKVFSLASVY